MPKRASKPKVKPSKEVCCEGKRLYRSKTNRVIAGVCGGIGEYFNIDPVLIRILWVLFALAGGSGVFAYIICWIIIPEEGEQAWWDKSKEAKKVKNEPPVETIGILLVALGVWFLLSNLNLFWWINFAYFWPAALIIIGLVIILLRKRGN